jgi:hypothetical protein
MADYYTQYSVSIPLKDDAQKQWARDVIVYLDGIVDETIDVDDTEHPLFHIAPASSDDAYGQAFDIDEDGLWVHDDGGQGNIDMLIPVIQDYLTKFDPKGALGFEWANTCSRPRLDAFGGGAVFVTADSFEAINSGGWLGDRLRAVVDHTQQKEQ